MNGDLFIQLNDGTFVASTRSYIGEGKQSKERKGLYSQVTGSAVLPKGMALTDRVVEATHGHHEVKAWFVLPNEQAAFIQGPLDGMVTLDKDFESVNFLWHIVSFMTSFPRGELEPDMIAQLQELKKKQAEAVAKIPAIKEDE